MRHYAAEPEGGSRAPRAEAAKTKGLTEPAHRVLQVQRDDVSVPQRHVVHDNASRGRTIGRTRWRGERPTCDCKSFGFSHQEEEKPRTRSRRRIEHSTTHYM